MILYLYELYKRDNNTFHTSIYPEDETDTSEWVFRLMRKTEDTFTQHFMKYKYSCINKCGGGTNIIKFYFKLAVVVL